MEETKLEGMKKDKILQAIYDTLEEQRWGGNGVSDLIIKLTFSGKFKMYPPDVRLKPKNHRTIF